MKFHCPCVACAAMACITGDETGLLKVWDVSRSSGAVLRKAYGTQSRSAGITGMCWSSRATECVAVSFLDGVVSLIDVFEGAKRRSNNLGHCAALPHAMCFIAGKLVMITKEGRFVTTHDDLTLDHSFVTSGDVHAAHIHRKFALAAIGGIDNGLCVYDLNGYGGESMTPIFRARNIEKHILDVEHKVFVTGACIVNPFVFSAATAYHQVYFYDRRAHDRPVQEYSINREVDRRPTTMLQWNCNKFLIGEASGDVHLYDTRRGFVSRAKLRGGSGSVRCMSKHPAAYPILSVAGLDRRARLYHVPTGKLLQTIYTKQKVNCVLLDIHMPLRDDVEAYTVSNSKNVAQQPSDVVESSVWDDMEAVVDEFDLEGENAEKDSESKASGLRKTRKASRLH